MHALYAGVWMSQTGSYRRKRCNHVFAWELPSTTYYLIGCEPPVRKPTIVHRERGYANAQTRTKDRYAQRNPTYERDC